MINTKKRPMYETREQLQSEKAVCTAFCDEFGLTAHKLPISYGLDYLLTKTEGQTSGKPVGFLEYKRRSFTTDRWPTVMLSLKKLMAAEQLKQVTGLTSVFMVQFDDAIGTCDFAKFVGKPELLEYGGRTTQTRDSGDIEPVVMIPVGDFHLWGND